MTLLAAALILLAAWIGWAYLDQRARLKREVETLLRTAEVVLDETGARFRGSEAQVLLRDDLPFGTDESGPGLSAKFLCKTPDGKICSVLVETARRETPASVTVKLLEPEEVDALRRAYPYLKDLCAALKQEP